MSEYYEIVPCNNGVGEWEISPIHETFDTRQQAEERLKELQLDNLTDADWKVLDNSFQDYISQFKDGVSDALLLGKRADRPIAEHVEFLNINLTSFYKQGYDFGRTMYCKMEGLDD
jgi:hypothetical protein